MMDPADLEGAEAHEAQVVAELAHFGGWTVGTAESVTAGRVVSALSAAPDASTWLRGGVVAYATEVKQAVLGLADCPVVSSTCASTMSENARTLLGADVVVSTTGVGGPEAVEDEPPGTVWVSVAGLGPTHAVQFRFADDGPAEVVARATVVALRMLADRLASTAPSGRRRSRS